MYTSTTRRQRRSRKRSGPATALGEMIEGDGGLGAAAVLGEPVGAMGGGGGDRRGRRRPGGYCGGGGVRQGRRGGRPAVRGGAGPVGDWRRRRCDGGWGRRPRLGRQGQAAAGLGEARRRLGQETTAARVEDRENESARVNPRS
jgi:hypothetical protein